MRRAGLALAGAGGVLASASYLSQYPKPAKVICSDSSWNRVVLSKCESLTEPRWPSFWCYNRHLQTLMAEVSKTTEEILWVSGKFRFEREHLTMTDGGKTALDWVHTEDESPLDARAPVCLFVHSITATTDERYSLVSFLESGKQEGWRMAIQVRRGNGGIRLETPNFSTIGNTDDLHQAVLTITDRYPHAPIFLVGLSAGTNSVMRYAAELEHPRFKRGETGARNIAGVVAAGAGFNLPTAWDKCEFPYDEVILSELKELFLEKNAAILQEHDKEQFQRAMESRTLNEFNENAALLAGFASYDEFNERNNTMNVAECINVPLLCLNADDDPLCVSENITPHVKSTFQSSKRSILAVTPFGGHLGWFEGWNGARWHSKATTEFVKTILEMLPSANERDVLVAMSSVQSQTK